MLNTLCSRLRRCPNSQLSKAADLHISHLKDYTLIRFFTSSKIVKCRKTSDERAQQDIGGSPGLSKAALEAPKKWVGYNPFKDPERWKGVPDWISYLSQNIRPDTLMEDLRKARTRNELVDLQSFNPEMMSELGKELNGAIFAVITEGKVKLYDDDHWYAREYKPKKKLPQQKTPGLKVEAIDLSGTNVIYEGLENLFHLDHILHLNLSDCKLLDEWGISRLAMMPSLVNIDVSYNPYVTERSLIPLQHIPNLRRLDIRGIKYFKYRPMALVMLEELLPNVVIVADDDHISPGTS